MAGTGFHDGELAVQQRAGVRSQAARLTGMLAPPHLNGGLRHVLAERDFAVLAARDADGRLWVTPLFGQRGFLDAHDATLHVGAQPRPGDALAELPAGQPVGLIAIDFATRRRVRVNGDLVRVGTTGLEIDVEQAFGNCPQYIRPRDIGHADRAAPAQQVRRQSLSPADAALIARSETFFLGTVHPSRGADASHRGGPAGFVRVEGDEIWWPDYPGNNMFNSLGNLAVDPTAALLFVDFDSGATLQLSGTAAVEWTARGVEGDDAGTGRRVRFALDQAFHAR